MSCEGARDGNTRGRRAISPQKLEKSPPKIPKFYHLGATNI